MYSLLAGLVGGTAAFLLWHGTDPLEGRRPEPGCATGNVLEGRGVNIVRADIEGRGTYYRVRIPAASRDEAIQLCTRYQAAGGSCFVSR